MTNRDRQFAALGLEYSEGIERATRFTIPATGREVRQVRHGVWEAQPWNDSYWVEFDNPLDALRAATPPNFRKDK